MVESLFSVVLFEGLRSVVEVKVMVSPAVVYFLGGGGFCLFSVITVSLLCFNCLPLSFLSFLVCEDPLLVLPAALVLGDGVIFSSFLLSSFRVTV